MNTRRAPRSPLLDNVCLEILEARTLFSVPPAPFTSTDIGTTNVAGTDSYNGSAITITAASQDAFGSADSIHYIYAKLAGDGSMTTTVTHAIPVPNNTLPLAGLDIRSSLDPTAQNVFFAFRADQSLVVNDRPTDGGTGTNQSVTSTSLTSASLRLSRSGSTITESVYDGPSVGYEAIGTTTLAGLPNTVYIGFAQGSQNMSVVSTATYTDFSTTGEVFSTASGIAGPTTTLSAPNITSPGSGPYAFGVTYASSNYVSAASIGNGNIVVTGPNGYSEAATVTNPPSADATSITAMYSVTPPPTTPGTYTITLEPNQVTDAAGNATAGQVLGTFVVSTVPSVTGTVTNALTGAPVVGQRVYWDINQDGVEQSNEPFAVTNSSGFYTFGPASNATYRVSIDKTAGETVATPTLGYSDQATTLGSTRTGVNFTVNVPSSTTGPDLTGSLTKVPTAIKRGKTYGLTLKITNAGSALATGKITILLATNAAAAHNSSDIIFKTIKKQIKLAPSASTSISPSFVVPVKTTPAGTRYLVGVIDSTNVIDSSSITNNIVVSPAITFT